MENYGPRFLILRGSTNSAAIGESLKTLDRYIATWLKNYDLQKIFLVEPKSARRISKTRCDSNLEERMSLQLFGIPLAASEALSGILHQQPEKYTDCSHTSWCDEKLRLYHLSRIYFSSINVT